MNKLIARINAKTLSFYLFMTAFIASMISPAYAGADLEKLSTTDGTKYGSFTGASGDKGSLDTSLSRLFDIGKYIAIVIGLFMAIGGLMSVSKAAKTEGQKSQMPGWITFAIGGIMTVVGTLMFILGNTAADLAGAGSNRA